MIKKLTLTTALLCALFTTTNAADKASGGPPPPFVEVATLTTSTWQASTVAVGSLRADQGIMLKPEIPGIVTKIFFKSGVKVAKGDPLVQINPNILQAQYEVAKSQFTLAKKELSRKKDLYQKQVASQADYDDAVNAYQVSKAQMDQAKAQLDQTLIRAPFPGMTGLRLISVGKYLSVGQNIVNLQDVYPMLIYIRAWHVC